MKRIATVVLALCMLTLFSAGALCAADSAASTSADKAKIGLVLKLFEVMNLNETISQLSSGAIQQIQSGVPAMMNKALEQMNLTAEERGIVEKEIAPGYVSQVQMKISAAFSPDALVTMVYGPLYVDHFSEEDLKAMIAFYESPAGKKMVAEMPKISAEAMKDVSELFMPSLIKQIGDITTNMQQVVNKRFKK